MKTAAASAAVTGKTQAEVREAKAERQSKVYLSPSTNFNFQVISTLVAMSVCNVRVAVRIFACRRVLARHFWMQSVRADMRLTKSAVPFNMCSRFCCTHALGRSQASLRHARLHAMRACWRR